jgi:hypothetical protein
MRHAREDYERFQDPANIIPDEEPVFLIRGQDKNASMVLRFWAFLAIKSGVNPEMVNRVLVHADKMDEWNTHKTPDMSGQ